MFLMCVCCLLREDGCFDDFACEEGALLALSSCCSQVRGIDGIRSNA